MECIKKRRRGAEKGESGGQTRNWGVLKKKCSRACYMKNQEGLANSGRAVSRGHERGTAEFPPSRQSSSYIPIRGWHSLISHIITLVRGALRSLAGYARRDGWRGTGRRRGRGRFGRGGETTGGSSWLFLCRACLWGTDLRPPWVLIHRSPPPPPGGSSCPNGPAPPRARGRETTPGDATCSFVRGRSREL